MTTSIEIKKNKINLTDYPYHKDIENRLLMAEFSVFDVDLLDEILNGSLSIPIAHLATALNVELSSVEDTLKKLESTKLFIKCGDSILIDKDMRKYYEFQISKFDTSFQEGIDYIKGLLRKVPIEHLPNWYALPRSSDEIFQAIIEKYLLTPKIYQRHLDEMRQEIPLLDSIITDLHQADNFQVPSKLLQEKHHLNKEQFEELMLLLEFNFICCISYTKQDEQWIEVVTPFAEWKEYLTFLKSTEKNKKVDINKASIPFEFVNKLTLALKKIKAGDATIDSIDATLLERLLQLQLVEYKNSSLTPLKNSDTFLMLREDQQAHLLYRLSLNALGYHSIFCHERNLREIEKSVLKSAANGWITFEAFITECTASIGQQPGVQLTKVGKKWSYVRPKYNQEEISFIERIIFEKLYEAGIVDIDHFQEKKCFRLTSFGLKLLGTD